MSKLKCDYLTPMAVCFPSEVFKVKQVVWMQSGVPSELPRKCCQCSSWFSSIFTRVFKIAYLKGAEVAYDCSTLRWIVGDLRI